MRDKAYRCNVVTDIEPYCELIVLGISAVADGVAMLRFELASIDGNRVEFGSIDRDIDMDGALGARD